MRVEIVCAMYRHARYSWGADMAMIHDKVFILAQHLLLPRLL